MKDNQTVDTWAQDPRATEVLEWLVEAGVKSDSNTNLLESYCLKLVEVGVPLFRMSVTQKALHPVFGAVAFEWQQSQGPDARDIERNQDARETFQLSPFYHMMSQGLSKYRERICEQTEDSRFPLLNEKRDQGATDYIAAMVAFEDWVEGEPIELDGDGQGAFLSWMAHGPGGFSDRDLGLIQTTCRLLCLALKAGTNRKTAQDLLGVYLGRDAGRRVLSGEIQRGSSRWIDAVICYFDLQGFTSMSQKIAGEDLIDMLNAYFGVVVKHIEDNGGDVLKFMGDGLIAIFDRDALSDATNRALCAVRTFGQDISEQSAAREKAGLPTLGYTAALHSGRVLYGNIGGESRLDFTVIGPHVNLAARIADMHKSLSQRIIVSEEIVKDAMPDEFELVSLGRYLLRGVEHPVELYSIYDGQNPA